MRKEYIEAGKIVTTHGIKGEVKLYPWCDDPEMFYDIETVYLDAKGAKPLKLLGVRFAKDMPLLKLEGIDSIDDAAKLRDKILYIHRDDIPMEEGEYLIQDLLGIQVVDADDGHIYGELTQVSPTGANDVYHIRFADGKERLIPAIPQVVIETDVEGGVMKIRPLEGLMDDENRYCTAVSRDVRGGVKREHHRPRAPRRQAGGVLSQHPRLHAG